jgi:hypothetical protein
MGDPPLATEIEDQNHIGLLLSIRECAAAA